MIYILIFIVVLLVLAYLNFMDYASPTFIFLAGWTLCSVMAYIYRNEWSLQVVAFPCTLMICGGAVIAFFTEVIYRKKYQFVSSKKSAYFYIPKSWKLVAFFFFQCCIYYLVAKNKMSFVSMTNLSEAIGELDHQVKFEDVVFKLPGYLNIPNQFCQQGGFVWTFLFPFYMTKGKICRKTAILCGLNLVATIVGSMLSGGRMPLVNYLIPTLLTWYLVLKNKNGTSKSAIPFNTQLKIVLVLMAVCLSFSQLGVLIGRDETILDDTNYMFAMYCGAEIRNLQDIVLSPFGNHNYGLPLYETFNGFYENVGDRFGLKMPVIKILGFNQVNGYALGNVYSCYKCYYDDLGILGFALVSPVILFMLWLYRKSLSSSMLSTGKISIHYIFFSYFIMGLALSFFSELVFTRISIEAILRMYIYIYILKWYLQGKNNKILYEKKSYSNTSSSILSI